MRRYITKVPKWYDREENRPKYKCAGGCGGTVDKPFNTCLPCTLDELNAKKAERERERPVPAA